MAKQAGLEEFEGMLTPPMEKLEWMLTPSMEKLEQRILSPSDSTPDSSFYEDLEARPRQPLVGTHRKRPRPLWWKV